MKQLLSDRRNPNAQIERRAGQPPQLLLAKARVEAQPARRAYQLMNARIVGGLQFCVDELEFAGALIEAIVHQRREIGGGVAGVEARVELRALPPCREFVE